MSPAPFLVTHGGLLWKLLVTSAIAISIVFSARKSYRNRAVRESVDLWLPMQLAFGFFRAAVAGVAVALMLVVTGRIALSIAGDRPFEGRYDDHVGQLNPVALAAATPVYRERALEKLAEAGFEFEDSCERRLAHGELERIIARADQCFAPRYWKAYAHLVAGQPCEASDALAGIDSATSSDPADLKLLVLSGIGCRRWNVVAAAAQRLGKLGPEPRWQCIADAASVRSGGKPSKYLTETDGCFPLFVATAPRIDAVKRVEEWATKPMPQRPPRLFSIVAIQHAPALFREIRTLEFLVPMDADSLVDMLTDHTSDFELLVPAFANLVLKAGADQISPSARVEWLQEAIIGEVILDNFGRARELVAELDKTAQSMTPEQAGPRPGSLEWARTQAGRWDVMIKFRLGEPIPQATDAIGDVANACLSLRRGQLPKSGEFTKDSLPIVQALLLHDELPFARAIRRQVLPFQLPQLIGAVAPRLRPVSPDVLAFVETPRWSIVHDVTPTTIAWEAAGRRDALRLLGEQNRGERWAQIARRQWELATDPELAAFFAFIAEARL